MRSIYNIYHFNFVDKIVIKKRQEMCDIISENLKDITINDALDIGTTNDNDFKSDNYLIKNLINISIFKSITDQSLKDNYFKNILTKSITEDFSTDEINTFRSDLVVSNATIEHVGSFENQIKMIKNISKLTKKYFIITTPNRYHPLDFHTKLPFIHWLPKKVHRKILSFFRFKFFSYEKNLNLLSENDLRLCLKISGITSYKIYYVYLFGFKSNLLVLGKIN